MTWVTIMKLKSRWSTNQLLEQERAVTLLVSSVTLISARFYLCVYISCLNNPSLSRRSILVQLLLPFAIKTDISFLVFNQILFHISHNSRHLYIQSICKHAHLQELHEDTHSLISCGRCRDFCITRGV